MYPGTPVLAAAPGGVGGRPVPPAAGLDRASSADWSGGAAADARRAGLLTGRDLVRRLSARAELDPADAWRLARSLDRSRSSGAAVMRARLGKPPRRPLPKDPADQTRAVQRWARRVTGKAAGIRAVRLALAQLHSNHGARARRRR